VRLYLSEDGEVLAVYHRSERNETFHYGAESRVVAPNVVTVIKGEPFEIGSRTEVWSRE
jgi:hypothetical protein